jgi:dUTP pyrophosphatase
MNKWLRRLVHRWLFTYQYDLVLMDGARVPCRAYRNDAGYDLYVSRSIKIPVGQMINVSTGVVCRANGVPAWIFLTGRSSTLIRHGLIVDNGIIDADYIGELFIKIYNPSKKVVYLTPGMRIGQMIVMPHTSIKFKYVEKIKVSGRGRQGFGSTGM